MSDKITNSPQIRFAGFTDTWEQRKAEEIFKTVSDKGHPELPVLSASQQLGMVRRDENGIDIQYDKKSVVNYKRVLPKQFVIHLRSFQGGFAHSSLEGITSPAYTIIDFKSESTQSDLFWNEIFTSKKFIKNLETVTYGIRDGRSISFNDFKTLLFTLPSYKEQEQIAGFFNDLNNLITLHQRELELLKDTKKSLLQKMFPKDGANVPEIRFAGFTDDWEQHSLSKVGEFVRTSIDPQATPDDSFVEYSMPSYDNGRNPETVFGNSMQSMRLKISGDVLLINKLNVRQKRIWLVEDAPSNAVASSEFMPFTSTEIDLAFLEQLMLSDKTTRDLESISSGTSNSQKRITPSDVLKYRIKLPVDRAEQEKIGSFFKNIDNLMTLHQSELNSLKNLKKSLLQQMFI
ncbi:restriction endonuclease subunit S [Metabacillus fastidiosus]|uniref:restriction endonuclease subunit S n=1 Tax=Metabacillus fastidiosus TaxID=1458 RepID=UPI003D26DA69